jgi:integrase
MAPVDTSYLKYTDSGWMFQKRLTESQQKAYGVKSLVRSLKTKSHKIALIRRDEWLKRLDNIEQYSAHPTYAKTLNNFAGLTPQEIREEYDYQADNLSFNYPHMGHEEYKGGLEEPTAAENATYQTLRYLRNPNQQNQVDDQYRLSFKKALEELMKERFELPKKTKDKYARSVKVYLDFLGREDSFVFAVNRITVRNFITEQRKSGDAPKTLANRISNLSAIWKYVRDAEDLQTINPFEDHKIAYLKSKLRYYLDWDIDKLREIIGVIEDENDRLPIYISWYTGSRIDEIYTLKEEDIYTDKATNIKVFSFKKDFITEHDGKNENSSRIVPIHSALFPMIQNFKGWKRPDSGAYSSFFGRAKRKCGVNIKRLAFHSIRGNTSTNLENLQVPEHIANKIVGHGSKGQSMTYGYYSQGPGLIETQKIIENLPLL